MAKASWVTGEKLRKRWRTGARTDGWMVDLSRVRSWDASRAVQRRGGDAAMVSTLQWEPRKFTTWHKNHGNLKAGTFSQSE